MSRSHGLMSVSLTADGRRVLLRCHGRRPRGVLRVKALVVHWCASPTPPPAPKPMFAAQNRPCYAPFHPRATCAPHLLRAYTVRPRVCECATQKWLVFEAGASIGFGPQWMQKGRSESVKVRPRTAIERVPYPDTQPALMLTLASQPNRAILVVHGAGERPRLQGVEFKP